MKKRTLLKTMLLALAMMPIGAWAADAPAAAKSWAFSGMSAFTTDDGTNLAAGVTANAWAQDGSNAQYGYLGALDNASLMANSVELDFTKGLKFTAPEPGTKDYGHALVRVSAKDKKLNLNAANVQLTIPEVSEGQLVIIKTYAGATGRYLTTEDLDVYCGFDDDSQKGDRFNVGVVKAGKTSVTVTTTGGMDIKDINVYNSADVTVLDETSSTNSVTSTKYNILVKRHLTAGVWNTIILPFDISTADLKRFMGAATVFAEFTGATTNTLSFTTDSDATKIAKAKPYLIKPGLSVEGVAYGNVGCQNTGNATTTVAYGDYTFTGIYAPTVLTTDDIYVASGDKLKAGNGTNSLKAFRAYFKYTGGSSPASELFLNIDGQTTSIDQIEGLEVITDGPVYNLNGQQVSTTKEGLAKGMYIMNGKKFIVK